MAVPSAYERNEGSRLNQWPRKQLAEMWPPTRQQAPQAPWGGTRQQDGDGEERASRSPRRRGRGSQRSLGPSSKPGIPNAAELQSPVGDRHSRTAPKRHRDPSSSVPRDDESQYTYTYDSYSDVEALTENERVLVLRP